MASGSHCECIFKLIESFYISTYYSKTLLSCSSRPKSPGCPSIAKTAYLRGDETLHTSWWFIILHQNSNECITDNRAESRQAIQKKNIQGCYVSIANHLNNRIKLNKLKYWNNQHVIRTIDLATVLT